MGPEYRPANALTSVDLGCFPSYSPAWAVYMGWCPRARAPVTMYYMLTSGGFINIVIPTIRYMANICCVAPIQSRSHRSSITAAAFICDPTPYADTLCQY